jgi:SAM-dependent methyltransferase
MDARICPACGERLEPWREVAASEPRDERRFELARCATCRSAVTLGPAPSADAYETGSYAPRRARGAPVLALLQRAATRRPVRMLGAAGLPRGARVLDVGAGGGRLVAALDRAGFDAAGIEPSARSHARARQAGLPVVRESVAGHADAGLGAVVLWHVLEHLEDPAAALARVHGWLAPGGLVLVGVPNLASWQARIAGEAWLHLDVPRHRTHFTPAGLAAVLGAAGLDVVQASHVVWEHNPVAMWTALLARCGQTPNFPWHALKRDVDITGRDVAITVAGAALAPVALGLEALAAAAGRGGTLAVVARRAGAGA